MSESKLERAVALWLEHRSTGVPNADLLSAHPELADLLGPMLDEDSDAVEFADGLAGSVAHVPLVEIENFRFIRELGRGGMGNVWQAQQLSLARDVALKLLNEDAARSPSSIARFRREALALSRLDHPNIVKIFEVGESAGTHYLAMELIVGPPLQSGHWSVSRLVSIFVSVADALEHAHHAGVIHRDVKPSNLLLRADASPVVTDFGLAVTEGSTALTRSGAFAGTPGYGSPEQAEGAAVDARTDVFALGATMYEVLTGCRPFDGSNEAAIVEAVRHHDPIEPYRLSTRISRDLSAIVMRALEKDKNARYQSAAALRQDLLAFTEGRPIAAKPISTVGRLRKWSRREPWRAALCVTLALGLPALTGLVSFVVAKAPTWRVTDELLEQEVIEAHISDALHALLWKGGDAVVRSRCRDVLDRDPLQPEAIGCLTLLTCRNAGQENALEQLRHHDEALRRHEALRELAVALNASDAGSVAVPKTALGALLIGLLGTTQPWRYGVVFIKDSQRPAYRRAAELIDLATCLTPRPRLAYYLQLAYAASNAQAEDLALRAAAVLDRLWPTNPRARLARAAALSRKEPDGSQAIWRVHLEEHEDDTTTRFQLICSLKSSGESEQALVHARRLASLLPSNATAQRVLAECLDCSVDRSLLIQAWRRVLELAPEDAEAYYNLGVEFSSAGLLPAAIDAYRKAIDCDRTMAEAHCNLGFALAARGQHADAIARYREALVQNPQLRQASINLIGAAKATADIDMEIDERERWVRANPTDAQGWIEVAAMRLGPRTPVERRDAKAAMVAAMQALTVSRGELPNPWKIVAYCWLQLGNQSAARRTIEMAISGHPNLAHELVPELARYPAETK